MLNAAMLPHTQLNANIFTWRSTPSPCSSYTNIFFTCINEFSLKGALYGEFGQASQHSTGTVQIQNIHRIARCFSEYYDYSTNENVNAAFALSQMSHSHTALLHLNLFPVSNLHLIHSLSTLQNTGLWRSDHEKWWSSHFCIG